MKHGTNSYCLFCLRSFKSAAGLTLHRRYCKKGVSAPHTTLNERSSEEKLGTAGPEQEEEGWDGTEWVPNEYSE